MFIEGIEVEAEGASEEGRILRDHCDLISESLKINLTDVLTIDLDLSFLEFDDARQGHEESGLAGTCAAYNTDFLASFNLEADVIEGAITDRPIAEGYILEFEATLGWPVLGSTSWAFNLLLWDIVKVIDTLRFNAVALEPTEAGSHMHEPSHIVSPVEKEHKLNWVTCRFILGNQEQGEHVEKEAGIHHAKVVPAPAAVMSNEMRSRLVEEHMLLVHNGLLLTESANYRGTAHAFVEVAVDGSP